MGPMTSVRDGSESLGEGHSNGSMEGGLPQELMVRTARLLHAGLEDGCELVQVTLLREGASKIHYNIQCSEICTLRYEILHRLHRLR